jgi:hypothetical protein
MTAPFRAPWTPADPDATVQQKRAEAEARIVRAALDLRDMETRGQFQTDAWWDALNRVRDAAAEVAA